MRASAALRRRSGQRGSVAIEYALILPLLLMFVIGLMDTARLIWSYATLTRAVEAAARCGAIDTTRCGTVAQIKSVAAAEAWGMTIDASMFTVTTAACGVQVKGSYDFTFIMPGFNYVVPTGTVTLGAVACFPS